MKKYVSPALVYVELRSEERFAQCIPGSCDYANHPEYGTVCSGIFDGLHGS